MTGIARTIRRRAQWRRPGAETAYLLGSAANAAHQARSIGQQLARENTAVPQAVPGRVVQDNPDPPVAVVADTSAAMGEARARASMAAARLAPSMRFAALRARSEVAAYADNSYYQSSV